MTKRYRLHVYADNIKSGEFFLCNLVKDFIIKKFDKGYFREIRVISDGVISSMTYDNGTYHLREKNSTGKESFPKIIFNFDVYNTKMDTEFGLDWSTDNNPSLSEEVNFSELQKIYSDDYGVQLYINMIPRKITFETTIWLPSLEEQMSCYNRIISNIKTRFHIPVLFRQSTSSNIDGHEAFNMKIAGTEVSHPTIPFPISKHVLKLLKYIVYKKEINIIRDKNNKLTPEMIRSEEEKIHYEMVNKLHKFSIFNKIKTRKIESKKENEPIENLLHPILDYTTPATLRFENDFTKNAGVMNGNILTKASITNTGYIEFNTFSTYFLNYPEIIKNDKTPSEFSLTVGEKNLGGKNFNYVAKPFSSDERNYVSNHTPKNSKVIATEFNFLLTADDPMKNEAYLNIVEDLVKSEVDKRILNEIILFDKDKVLLSGIILCIHQNKYPLVMTDFYLRDDYNIVIKNVNENAKYDIEVFVKDDILKYVSGLVEKRKAHKMRRQQNENK